MTEAGQQRARDHGLVVGILPPGHDNAITDVPGVAVGHTTLIEDVAPPGAQAASTSSPADSQRGRAAIRTGVTAILPHGGNIFQEKVPAAIHIGNGFGKLAGYSILASVLIDGHRPQADAVRDFIASRSRTDAVGA